MTAPKKKGMRQPQGGHLRFAELPADEGAQAGSEEKAGDVACLRKSGHGAAPGNRRVLGQKHHGAGIFPAVGKALRDAADNQQKCRRGSDLGIGRQQSQAKSRDAHQRDGCRHQGLASIAVTDVAEKDRTEGAGEIADRKDRKSREKRRQTVVGRKKQRSMIGARKP